MSPERISIIRHDAQKLLSERFYFGLTIAPRDDAAPFQTLLCNHHSDEYGDKRVHHKTGALVYPHCGHRNHAPSRKLRSGRRPKNKYGEQHLANTCAVKSSLVPAGFNLSPIFAGNLPEIGGLIRPSSGLLQDLLPKVGGMGHITNEAADRISIRDNAVFAQSANLSRQAQESFQPLQHRVTSEQPAFLDLSMGGLYDENYTGMSVTSMSIRDSATMIALTDEVIAQMKRDGSYQKFELYDPKAPGNGSAQDTGTVIDYKPQELRKSASFALGMDYEEVRDVRIPTDKLHDFLSAAANNATNPDNYQQFVQGELDKLIGIGEGLNLAKEQTKRAAASGWKALTDGTVADFLSKPNAINETLFKTVGNILDAMAKDPNATNKGLEALGTAVMQASEHYNKLPNRAKGHVIGETMFAMVNPEGSTKSGEAALKIADTVATHIDAAVIKTVDQSMEAIKKAGPEVADHIKKSLYDYIKGQGLTGPELEAAGIPRGFFNDIEQTTGKGDNFFAMSKADETADRIPNRGADREPLPEKMLPSEGFVSELQTALDTLSETESSFLKEHSIRVQPVGRMQDVMPNLDKRTAGIYDPTERTIYVAEEAWSMGQWRKNSDVMFELRHEFGHAWNAKSDPFGEWLSESQDFRAAFRQDIANISPEKLDELQLSFDRIARQRDEVFSDMYAHASGIRSNNPRSIQMKQLFPKCFEYVQQKRLEL
jgi:hypothetical protein